MFLTYQQRYLTGIGIVTTLMVVMMFLAECGPEPWHYWAFNGLLIIALIMLIWAKSLTRTIATHSSYKGVKIKKVKEWEDAWSTHITGSTPFFWRACAARLWARITRRPDPYPRSVKLFTDKVDRQQLEQCSLQAFATLLDALALDPKAIIISSSVLNFENRNPQRLSDRIRVVMTHKDHWQYVRVMRTQPWLESLVGRLFWGWEKRPGDTLLAMCAPGIVVWHAGRPIPRLPRSIQIKDENRES